MDVVDLSGLDLAGKAVILGGGRFGRLALERLGSRAALVVEPQPGDELLAMKASLVKADGIQAASQLLALPPEQGPRWLVPTLPVHLLGAWLALEIAIHHPIMQDLPPQCLPQVPLLFKGDHGESYLSLADFVCPDDCPEPADKCTVTGLPRGKPLYQRLEESDCPGHSKAVLQSHQLAPGIGGVRCSGMLDILAKIKREKGLWMVATACRCHGVAQGLRFVFPNEAPHA